MRRVKYFLNGFKYIFTALCAFIFTLNFFLNVKVDAKTTYTFDGDVSISSEAFGTDLPTKSSNQYLTRDFVLNSDYTVPSGVYISLYLNGHNINLNGHKITVLGSLTLYEDRTNQTFYSLDSSGNVIEGSDHVINGGLITGATSDYAITVNGSTAKLYLKGANVFGNTAGGVKITKGEVYLEKGVIAGNKAANGAGVYVNSGGFLNMVDGVIEYNTATTAGAGVYQNGYIEVCKKSIVRNNKLSSGINNNVYIPDTNTSSYKQIRVVAGEMIGHVGITSSMTTALTYNYGYYNNASTCDVSKYFFSDVEGKYVVSNGQTGNGQEAIFSTTAPEHTHNSKTYTKWTNTSSLPTSGNYYLANDVKLTSAYEPNSTVNICLNGHNIDLNNKYINLKSSAVLSIYDCSKQIHYYDVDNTGKAVIGGNRYQYVGGAIYGATSHRAVTVLVDTASFNMYGGAILGNTSGAVEIDRPSTSGSAKLNFSDCYIVGNNTKTANGTAQAGSAIYAGDHDGITLSNVTIQHNKSYDNHGAIWTAGSVSTVSRIKVSRGTYITENIDVDGNLCNFHVDRQKGHLIDIGGLLSNQTGDHRSAKIGVTSTSVDTYFTGDYDDHEALNDPSKYFSSDKGGYLITKETYTDHVNGGQYTEAALTTGHKHSSTTYSGVTMLTHLSSNSSERYLYLKNDITFETDWTVPTGGRINVCLNGYKLDLNGHTITVPSNAKIRFLDCSNYSNRYYVNSNGIAVVDNELGTEEFKHSYIYDSSDVSSLQTANSFFMVTGGTLELEDVNVFGAYTNASANTGANAAICVNNGTFTMTGGMIAGCRGRFGSALHVFNHNYSSTNTKATLTNVKLANNTGSSGGAAYVYYGQLTATDCYFVNNTASSGGALNLNIGSKATISYSYFYNNYSSSEGGAICASNGDSASITRCEFAYNLSKSNGGAIYCSSYMDLSYVTLVYNEARPSGQYGRGGGAFYYAGNGGSYVRFINNVLISHNKSTLAGGGLYIGDKLIAIKDEIIIKNNTVSDETNNVTLKNGSYFYVEDKLTGNASIGVNAESEAAITANYGAKQGTTAASTYFKCDFDGADVELRNDEVYYVPPHVHTVTYQASGNKLIAKCSECGETIATLEITGGTYTYDKAQHGITSNSAEFDEILGITTSITPYYTSANTWTTTSSPKNANTYSVEAVVTIGTNSYTLKTTLIIEKKLLTVSGITATNKEYDKTTTATLSQTNITYTGLLSGDQLSVSATGAFADYNVGTNKTVNITYGSLSGNASGNYTIDTANSQKTTTASITARSIKVYNITASNKEYDGTTTATLVLNNILYDRKCSGDSITVTATGTFSDKNAGTNKTVTISNITLSGASASNYTINTSTTQTTTTATITKKEVTISGIIAANKVYDGTTTIDIRYYYVKYEGKLDSDALSVTAVAELDDPNYTPNAVTANITELVLSGSSKDNYVVSANSQNTIKISMQPRTVTASGITAEDKVYDGTTAATLNCDNVVFDGIVEGDVLTLSATGTFASTNVGTGITVSITDYQLGGASFSNYQFSGKASQKTTTASITKRTVAVSGIVAKNKVYDGSTDVEFDLDNVVFDNIVSGDELLVIVDGAFVDADYGIDKLVNITNITLSGELAANYQLAEDGNQEASYASITKKIMNVTITGYNGIYDKEAHTISLSGFPAASVIKFSSNGNVYTFDMPTYTGAGTYKVYCKIECDNYETFIGDAYVEIAKRTLYIEGLAANNKEYDGTTNVEFDYTLYAVHNYISGDDLSVNPVGAFSDKNAGTNKTVTYQFELSGDDSNNYCLETTNGTLTASISKKGITVSNIKANDKYYDESTVATVDLSEVLYDGLVEGDELSLTLNANFVDSMYEESKTVNLTNLALTGDDSINYYLKDDSQATAIATIFKKLMTCSAYSVQVTYDKQAHKIVIADTLDDVTITYSEAEDGTFGSDNFSYTNAGVYTVWYKVEKEDYETIKGSATVTIYKQEVIVSGIKADNKIYDGTTEATLDFSDVTIDGLLSGDTLEVSATGEFDNKNAGSNKTVNISNLVLSDETNYKVSTNSQIEANANISSKVIEITSIKVLDKKYDKTTDATIDYDNVIIEGLVDGDKVTITATASFEDAKSGKDTKVTITDIRLDGLDKNNYKVELNQIEASANIIKVKTNSLSGGAVAGIIVAAITVSGIIGFALYWFIFKKKKA